MVHTVVYIAGIFFKKKDWLINSDEKQAEQNRQLQRL